MPVVQIRKKKSHSNLGDMWTQLMSHENTLEELYAIGPMERIELVKAGAPAQLVTFLVEEMAITKEHFYETIGVARATVDRKVRAGTRLNRGETEGIVGIAQLVGQAEQMVGESGEPEGFDGAKWVAAWLDRPLPALGGKTPGTLMDTSEGRGLVSDLLARMQSGAYA